MSDSQVPLPPSRSAHGGHNPYNQGGGGGHPYEYYGAPGVHGSQPSSVHSFAPPDPYVDDPYQGYSSSTRSVDRRLGEVNPDEIADDGDDALHHPMPSKRNSMLSSAQTSDRGQRGAAGVAGAAAGGGVIGGLLSSNANATGGGGSGYDLAEAAQEKPGRFRGSDGHFTKKCRLTIIAIVAVFIAGAIVAAVLGSMAANGRLGGGGGNKSGGSSGSGDSADQDTNKNGDLDINSAEIKKLMSNTKLHKVFPGMDYTPINSQYPDCMHNPPSQNNITRDVAVLSKLTNKIRLYGTDCNQTQMVLHAIDRLNLKNDVKVWLGVWQDGNKTTNARQLSQMWDILDEYGGDQFEGLIVANEILFREEMAITELGTLLSGVRTNLTSRKINLPVATSDLGDDWTQALADESDYIMANIHPFFSGTAAEDAAAWTMNFWKTRDGPLWKSDSKKNIISETGWPSGGGTNCGEATSCAKGSVAGVSQMNQFMKDWICPALNNGTQYFWFSAFDEPWKIRFNEKGKEWEDKWGLMDVNRNLKDGIEIPDCGGKTV